VAFYVHPKMEIRFKGILEKKPHALLIFHVSTHVRLAKYVAPYLDCNSNSNVRQLDIPQADCLTRRWVVARMDVAGAVDFS
jgi:hypothetical protein